MYVMVVTRDQLGEFSFAIERCSGGSSNMVKLREAKSAAKERLNVQ